MKNIFSSAKGIIFVGALIGIIAPLLQFLGNPPNMGICVACFERDIAGALGFHGAKVVQYIRPEIYIYHQTWWFYILKERPVFPCSQNPLEYPP